MTRLGKRRTMGVSRVGSRDARPDERSAEEEQADDH